ncbi:MAG: HAD family hydrolase [Candidatus Eisenbacteria bacterium]|nr:HAD-IB family hydrolase [Candidatus Eisenbacteria bacterium]
MATFRGGAFFDVDKTLLPGVSVEALLARRLLLRRLPGRFRLLPFLIEGARLLPQGLVVARKANKAYLRGATPTELRSWGERLFQEEVAPRLGERGRRWVERERAAGRAIVLLTGMPEILLEPLAAFFRADLAVGTPLEVDRRGRFSGRRSGPHPYGSAKLEIARALASERGWLAEDCVAYGDHASDAALLAWAGKAYAVDPDAGLRRAAQAHGWTILEGAAED